MWYKNIIYFRLTGAFRYNCDILTGSKKPHLCHWPYIHTAYPVMPHAPPHIQVFICVNVWRIIHIHIFRCVTYCFYWICYTIYYYIQICAYVELWHNCNSVWYEQQDVRAAHLIRTKREHTMSESGTNQLWEQMQNIRYF